MADWLAPFRAREPVFRANAAALLMDPACVRVALAWRGLVVSWELPETPCPETEGGAWGWLWEGVDADEEALAQAAGIAPRDARYYLRVLIANRLIYPDGTVADIVDEIGNRQVSGATLPRGLG